MQIRLYPASQLAPLEIEKTELGQQDEFEREARLFAESQLATAQHVAAALRQQVRLPWASASAIRAWPGAAIAAQPSSRENCTIVPTPPVCNLPLLSSRRPLPSCATLQVLSHQQLLAEAGAQLQLLQRELAEAREGWALERAEMEEHARQVWLLTK